MKEFRFSGVKTFDCPKCGTCATPGVTHVAVAECPPTAEFLWITCKTCGYGKHMKVKDD
jgi:predicted nucleic-acid-binding Zn-ribbon protein